MCQTRIWHIHAIPCNDQMITCTSTYMMIIINLIICHHASNLIQVFILVSTIAVEMSSAAATFKYFLFSYIIYKMYIVAQDIGNSWQEMLKNLAAHGVCHLYHHEN